MRLAPEMEEAARVFLERTLGLRVDLAAFYRFAESDARLGPLVQRYRGVKPPRFPSLFEALGNGIACQQITLTQGIHLLNRLTQTYGLAFPNGDPTAHAFLRPQDLTRLAPEKLKPLGFSGQKGRCHRPGAPARPARYGALDSRVCAAAWAGAAASIPWGRCGSPE